MADAIWCFVRHKSRAFTNTQWESITGQFAEQEEGLDTLDEWIEENIQCESLPVSCVNITFDDPHELMAVRRTTQIVVEIIGLCGR